MGVDAFSVDAGAFSMGVWVRAPPEWADGGWADSKWARGCGRILFVRVGAGGFSVGGWARAPSQATNHFTLVRPGARATHGLSFFPVGYWSPTLSLFV